MFRPQYAAILHVAGVRGGKIVGYFAFARVIGGFRLKTSNQGSPGGCLQNQDVGQHATTELLQLVGVRGRVQQRHSYCVRAGSKQSAGASKQR